MFDINILKPKPVSTLDDYYLKRIKESEYPCVHKNDWIPVSVINPDMVNGPWIAGGAALAWFKNEPVGSNKDIDVFCRDADQARKVIAHIKSIFVDGHYDASDIFVTDNATTVSARKDGDWKIQVITCNYFNSIEDVIASFDLTVCQVGTDGHNWILGKDTAKDIRQKNLRFNIITPQTIKRLVKYWTYGYIPVEGTIEKIQQSRTACLNDFSKDEEYSNVF